MTLKIQDTESGEKRVFEPLVPGKVGMYVCGVTPYDRCHLGHARCYVVYDLVYRYLKYIGYDVTYVRNFTDVDDKLIARGAERGMTPMELAQENIDYFYRDMDALNILRPTVEPRVSTSIPQIIALVQRLVDRGIAYPVDGDVYYSIEKFPQYGKLSKRSQDEMMAGASGRVDENQKKRHPMDFAVWKASKPGEPHWTSPWGEGRPGWHIECSAMSMSILGETFDIHGGGRDLVFPHHENEIAQSEGATGKQYVRYFMHNGFVNIDKQKMSKSLGNFFSVEEILDRYEPLVLRWFMMSSTHYKNPINFSTASLNEAAAKVAYFYETLKKAQALIDESSETVAGPLPEQAFIDGFEGKFTEAMDDDFNVVRAIEPLFEAFKILNECAAAKKKKRAMARMVAIEVLGKIKKLDDVYGMFGENPAEYLARHREKAAKRAGVSLDWIQQKIDERLAARDDKNWAKADEIRDELLAKGVVLMDSPSGTDWAVNDVVNEESKEA